MKIQIELQWSRYDLRRNNQGGWTANGRIQHKLWNRELNNYFGGIDDWSETEGPMISDYDPDRKNYVAEIFKGPKMTSRKSFDRLDDAKSWVESIIQESYGTEQECSPSAECPESCEDCKCHATHRKT